MKIKKWEVFLAIFLVLLLFMQVLLVDIIYDQKSLSEKLVRMHIIANSNTTDDQNLKLKVRDAVNMYLADKLYGCENRDEAARIIKLSYNEIVDIAEGVLIANGCNHTVDVKLSDEYYPTRHYVDFSLPAGEYSSLQIRIGEATGDNWWCVVFPPLCTSAASTEDFSTMSLSDDEINFITSNDGGVVFKFGILEFINKVRTGFWGE